MITIFGGPIQYVTAAPTRSRGRPAVPVYPVGVTVPRCYRSVVDSSAAVDNSGVGR
jgi:hypothetical protein